MPTYNQTIEALNDDLSAHLQKRLKPLRLVKIHNKLGDTEDEQVEALLNHAKDTLKDVKEGNRSVMKHFLKTIKELKQTVRDKYGYIEKGELVSEYMSMGIGISLAFGAVFMFINPAFIAITLAVGVAVGLSVGQHKENDAEKQNKLY
ncbi:MAG: hypothetical protein UMR38_03180 [Candidatus Izemoplasma sp.]|nr:hypothetical protein [Candidatus Izemoplasma sp.]